MIRVSGVSGSTSTAGFTSLTGILCAVKGLCVPESSSTSCDQLVFVDLAADVSPSPDTVLVELDRRGYWFQRRRAVQGTMRPVLVVVGLVLAQDLPQVDLIPDESAVKELTPASPDPAFGDRVHAGRPDIA
jgi:hypothetical protein